MMAEGIVDPAKVARSAIQNAASVSALFLTTEAVVADKPKKRMVTECPAEWEICLPCKIVSKGPFKKGPFSF